MIREWARGGSGVLGTRNFAGSNPDVAFPRVGLHFIQPGPGPWLVAPIRLREHLCRRAGPLSPWAALTFSALTGLPRRPPALTRSIHLPVNHPQLFVIFFPEPPLSWTIIAKFPALEPPVFSARSLWPAGQQSPAPKSHPRVVSLGHTRFQQTGLLGSPHSGESAHRTFMRASARTQATKWREGTDPGRGKARLPQSASPMQRSTIRSRRTLGKGEPGPCPLLSSVIRRGCLEGGHGLGELARPAVL